MKQTQAHQTIEQLLEQLKDPTLTRRDIEQIEKKIEVLRKQGSK